MKPLKSITETDYIQQLIKEGEHVHQDFKFEISDARKIAKSLSAFANTEGGRLLVGVKDNGKIAGIRSEEEIYMIESAATMYCQPPVTVQNRLFTVMASGADIVITRENPMAEEDLLREIRRQVEQGKHHIMAIITEKTLDVKELAKKITEHCGIEAKAEVLGRIQRGGTPVAFDRYLASVMGVFAIDTLIKGETGVCVGILNNTLTATPIEEALKMTNKPNKAIKRMLCRTR